MKFNEHFGVGDKKIHVVGVCDFKRMRCFCVATYGARSSRAMRARTRLTWLSPLANAQMLTQSCVQLAIWRLSDCQTEYPTCNSVDDFNKFATLTIKKITRTQ